MMSLPWASRWLRAMAWALAAVAFMPAAHAQGIEVRQFTFEPGEEAYVVNADFEIGLPGRVEEALNNGVALSFVVEFELSRPRWYWFDETTATSRLEVRLSYNPLLRQYRVTNGSLQRNFSALADALTALEQIRSWPVVPRDRMQADSTYVAQLRMRLDTSQLPKPFQISALTERDWSMASAWRRLSVAAATVERAAR
jgi:hypothetical protein